MHYTNQRHENRDNVLSILLSLMRVLEAIEVDNRGLLVISKVGLTLLLTLSIPGVTSGCFITFGIFSELESVLDVLGVGLQLPEEELFLLPKPFLFLCTRKVQVTVEILHRTF